MLLSSKCHLRGDIAFALVESDSPRSAAPFTIRRAITWAPSQLGENCTLTTVTELLRTMAASMAALKKDLRKSIKAVLKDLPEAAAASQSASIPAARVVSCQEPEPWNEGH